MYKRDLIIISAFTGFVIVPDGGFDEVHKLCEQVLGRPIFTHELASLDVQQKIREALMPEIRRIVMESREAEPDGGASKRSKT